jgi:hypothetical protein
MLSAFMVAQIVFDVAVVALAAVYLLTRKPPAPPEPPEWYGHFLKLAQELMTATEPVLERLESRAVSGPGGAAGAGTPGWAPGPRVKEPAFAGSLIAADVAQPGVPAPAAPPLPKPPRPAGSWAGAVAASSGQGSGAWAGAAAAGHGSGPWAGSADAPAHDKYEKARQLLRSGAKPEEVAAHIGLAPGELRLLTRIVAAESRPRSR